LIVIAVVLAEVSLVYIAIGLGCASAVLLVAEAVRSRKALLEPSGTGGGIGAEARSAPAGMTARTDGLGKASVLAAGQVPAAVPGAEGPRGSVPSAEPSPASVDAPVRVATPPEAPADQRVPAPRETGEAPPDRPDSGPAGRADEDESAEPGTAEPVPAAPQAS